MSDDQVPPRVPDLPELVAPDRAVLLIVDAQEHFLGEGVAVDVPGFIANLERLIAAARRAGVPCMFIRAVETPEASTGVWVSRHASKPHRLGNREGSASSQFHPRIQPNGQDTVITKTRYSSFIGTGLEDRLREMGVNSVVVTGVQSDVCVQMTAVDAFQRDFWTVTVSDCTTTRSVEDQEHAMREAARNWGIVATADDVIQAWAAGGNVTAERQVDAEVARP